MRTLADIIERTRADTARLKAGTPLDVLRDAAAVAPPPRDLAAALSRVAASRPAVIAEIKRKSPSAGWIRPEYESAGFAPESIARTYHAAGAAAISCLTDEPHFAGAPEFVARVRSACPLPVLRKDFLIDPWQVWHSRVLGSDAILLIAECLDDALMGEMTGLARRLEMTVLIESHDEANLRRAMAVWPGDAGVLLGINNRDLTTMRVDAQRSARLAGLVADRSRVVAESGLRTREQVWTLYRAGVARVLAGEHFMRQPDPGAALANWLSSEG